MGFMCTFWLSWPVKQITLEGLRRYYFCWVCWLMKILQGTNKYWISGCSIQQNDDGQHILELSSTPSACLICLLSLLKLLKRFKCSNMQMTSTAATLPLIWMPSDSSAGLGIILCGQGLPHVEGCIQAARASCVSSV